MILRRRHVLAALAARAAGAQRTSAGAIFGNAEAYERFMGRWSRLAAPVFLDFATLPKRGRVLDVGSGTGSLAFAIARRNPDLQVWGIDPAAEFVAFAQKSNSFGARVQFEIGDAQRLTAKDASFDSALSLFVFNFIPDPAKALLEVRRVTRPGGSVSAAVWDYGNGMQMLRTFWEAAKHLDPAAVKLDEQNMPLRRAGELAALWKQAGFQNVREEAREIPMKFASFADYWDPFLLGQGPAGAYARRLPVDRQAALRNELRRRLASAGEDRPFEMRALFFAVTGAVR